MTVAFEAIVGLLKELIATPSLSREEGDTAEVLTRFLIGQGVPVQRQGYNVWARSRQWDAERPVLLLNSHHDTVKPNPSWQREPFVPTVEGDRLYGLGSNDAGGPLVSLIATFLHFYDQADLPWNLLLAATAEEEISGPNGIAALLPELGPIDLAVVGEPTLMQPAIAEKGLMVIDGTAHGVAGHAAREEGVNAIYEALADLAWLRDCQFERVSEFLGPVKVSVTQIEAGTQHNVVPDLCRFVIDVRTNELYSNEEAFAYLDAHTRSTLKARSFRLNSSRLEPDHPVVERALTLGLTPYGSPTLSDQALMPFPSLKIGPGDSARSHTADEYIGLSELREGIDLYIRLLEGLPLV
ncbi:MAG: M20/M25/M40 family metallo-hydrolase [Bacteroidetes bacterium]|nr:MAG: M20/M25/M40 family metallo-hydrolase [Bacteroidota bacterium]